MQWLALGLSSGKLQHGLNELSRVSPKGIKPIIGLAGGIGAGKTSVARILESLGVAVIDSDRLGHEQLGDPDVIAELRKWWGDCILTPDGKVDRRAVGSIVFADPGELERLEGLLFPRIDRRREELMAKYVRDVGVKAIAIDAAKLFEAGVNEICDAIVFVDADLSTRVRRVAESRDWTRDELIRRENLQNPLDKKRVNADYLVNNNSDIDELRSQVERVFSSILAAFK